MADGRSRLMQTLAAEILIEEAWFNALPLSARDDLGDRNFAVSQHKRAVALAQAVQQQRTRRPTTVRCAICGAAPGELCINQNVYVGTKRMARPHRIPINKADLSGRSGDTDAR
jgi:hypothetical protein